MASNRFTAAEKGKGTASFSADDSRKRIRAPEFDFTELVRDNAKTLIGRLTNPKEQRVESLILELPKKWALRGKIVGANLGNNCFQFRFDRDEDLQCVLLNRPYQQNNWMVVIERWEPVISSTFPSRIPFWITVRGLPLHFWHEKMVYKIGDELGHLEDYEITKTSAKIRILLEALEPLTMESVVDFSTGEEIPITFEYERLANHCSTCFMLTHTSRLCPRRQQRPRTDSLLELPPAKVENEAYVSRRNSSQPEKPIYITSSRPPIGGKSRHEEESFYRRVDRHGRPFGERITT